MLINIVLHGFMGKKYGKSVKLAGENMFQIMGGLCSRFGAAFKEDVRANNWHLIKGRINSKDDIGQDELATARLSKTLHLVPAVAGESAAVRIVIGVVLIVMSWGTNPTGWTMLGQAIGVSLVMGGVSELLTKSKLGDATKNQDTNASAIYNGALNVTSQGGPIPLIYGRVQRASSVVISTDFSADEA
jgi:predicted phage tail protein